MRFLRAGSHVCLAFPSLILGSVLLSGPPLYATPVPAPARQIDAARQQGADACAKINAAFGALPRTGGMVDARSIQGPQPCRSNPFAGVTASGLLLLGGATFQTTASWIIPQNITVTGLGRGDPTRAFNTSIQAVGGNPGFPSETPVVQFGAATPAEGVHLENITIDCNNQSGAIGVQNIRAQEQSGIRHVAILNCPKIDLDVEGSAAQNSGPYEDVEILNFSGGDSSTIPVVVNRVAAFRGIHGLTINADGVAQPDVGIQMDSSGTLTDMHCEHVATCLLIGSRIAANAVVVNNLECGPAISTCIAISGEHPSQDILLTGIVSTAGNLLNDEIFGTQLKTHSLAFYLIGNGAGSSKTRISSDTRIPMKLPGMAASIKKKSSNYTLTTEDYWLNVSGPSTITIPHATIGQLWVVLNTGSDNVTLTPDAGHINGAPYLVLPPKASKEIVCDGRNCFAH
jgi:hypothetical protein